MALMRAFGVDEFGGTGSVRELPVPTPATGQVLVRVRAAGVNPFDLTILSGRMRDAKDHHFPLVPGFDLAGTVEVLGAGVEGWAAGDRVFGSLGKPYFGEGAFAEFTTAATTTLAATPAGIDDVTAATLPTPAVTALTLLNSAAVDAGTKVLIVGASGGVGGFAVQLAAVRGATVIAVCRGDNTDYVKSLGADDVIDYVTEDVGAALDRFHPGGIDSIVDVAGDKESVTQLARRLRTDGRVSSAAGGADIDALAARNVVGQNIMAKVNTDDLIALAELVERQRIKAPAVATYTLDQAGRALDAIATRHTRGKLIVIPA